MPDVSHDIDHFYRHVAPRPAESILDSERRSIQVRCFKYVLSSIPLLLGFFSAAVYWILSQREVYVVGRAVELSPRSSANIAAIFIFAGCGFTAMFWAYSAFRDWRAWDDRRQLLKALEDGK